jgi:hypothetical protein
MRAATCPSLRRPLPPSDSVRPCSARRTERTTRTEHGKRTCPSKVPTYPSGFRSYPSTGTHRTQSGSQLPEYGYARTRARLSAYPNKGTYIPKSGLSLPKHGYAQNPVGLAVTQAGVSTEPSGDPRFPIRGIHRTIAGIYVPVMGRRNDSVQDERLTRRDEHVTRRDPHRLRLAPQEDPLRSPGLACRDSLAGQWS